MSRVLFFSSQGTVRAPAQLKIGFQSPRVGTRMGKSDLKGNIKF